MGREIDRTLAANARATSGACEALAQSAPAARDGSAAGWKRVALSPRDWEILQWAHEQGFLASEQVARWFEGGEPNPHVLEKEAPTLGTLRRRERPGSWYMSERLRKLVRFDVLRRVPVFTENAAALVPGRVGFELLEGTGRSNGLAWLDTIDWKNFGHDRTATDVRWFFEKECGASWRSERLLRCDLRSKQVPDAIVTLDSKAIALEVELTRKSLPRYIGIFERYLQWTRSALDSVLYVVPAEPDLRHVFTSILPAVLRSTTLWRARQPDLSLFRFTTLKALASKKTWSTFANPGLPTEGDL